MIRLIIQYTKTEGGVFYYYPIKDMKQWQDLVENKYFIIDDPSYDQPHDEREVVRPAFARLLKEEDNFDFILGRKREQSK